MKNSELNQAIRKKIVELFQIRNLICNSEIESVKVLLRNTFLFQVDELLALTVDDTVLTEKSNRLYNGGSSIMNFIKRRLVDLFEISVFIIFICMLIIPYIVVDYIGMI